MPRGRKHHIDHHAPHHARHHKDDSDVAVLEDRRRDPGKLPVQNKVQAFDATKGWDMTKYDMRRGEIGIPSIPHPHEPATIPLPGHQATGFCVECKKPIAPGQTYVCREHIRAN